MKNHYDFDREKIEPFLKILLTGLPTAMAVILGQLLASFNFGPLSASFNILLLFSLIALVILFLIISFFFLTKKRRDGVQMRT